ncbi:hypothetical protein ScPMuIL_006681 [Solemya velum]
MRYLKMTFVLALLCVAVSRGYVRKSEIQSNDRTKLILRAKGNACIKMGGRCQDDSQRCVGSYVSGKCPGSIKHRCCLPTMDEACTMVGGLCQDDSQGCGGSYVSGKCSGPITRKCCLPTIDDVCTEMGGRCQDDSQRCGGSYVSGKCSGPITRRCCSAKPIISYTGFCENVKIISRDSWGARRPKDTEEMHLPVNYTFIHHTKTGNCSNTNKCMGQLKNIQDFHMYTRNWSDIAYNFLIGGDGQVYEGRGWSRTGAHTLKYNRRSIAISFIGDFMSYSPVSSALTASEKLIECAKKHRVLTTGYALYGHRDVGATTCPGDTLYKLIQQWPHYGRNVS